jgi:hypothetical protein
VCSDGPGLSWSSPPCFGYVVVLEMPESNMNDATQAHAQLDSAQSRRDYCVYSFDKDWAPYCGEEKGLCNCLPQVQKRTKLPGT